MKYASLYPYKYVFSMNKDELQFVFVLVKSYK